MLQFDLQFYEELTVAWVRTVKFISGAFFWPTGQLVYLIGGPNAEWSKAAVTCFEQLLMQPHGRAYKSNPFFFN